MNFEELAKQLVEAHNQAGVDDFDGFTPEEMMHVLYYPFSKECPIKINDNPENAIVMEIPLFKIAVELLRIIIAEDRLKLTSRGYLPPKVVMDIYEKRMLQEELIEKGIVLLRREENWKPLQTVKIVLMLSGIVRKSRGDLIVTKQVKKDLENENYGAIFLKFFHAYTTKFSWAYNDRFSNEVVGQMGFMFLLHLLNKYGDIPLDFRYYSHMYFKAFPSLQMDNEGHYCVRVRFFERFAEWFGFITADYKKGRPFVNDLDIQKTKILSHIIKAI
jgi:hypothetical protein